MLRIFHFSRKSGVPNVFLGGGRMTDSAVDKLLTWENE